MTKTKDGNQGCDEHTLVEEIHGYIHYVSARPNNFDANSGSWVAVLGSGEMVQVDYCPWCGQKLPVTAIPKSPP